MSGIISPIKTSSTGCWQNFITGVKILSARAWIGMKKTAIWAAGFFSALAVKAYLFVKLHSVECLYAGAGFLAGVAIALIFARYLGCCNRPRPVNELEHLANLMSLENER